MLGKGTKGKQVRIVQEWLCLHGRAIVIDGDFGPATEQAVKEFQKKAGLIVTGAVDESTLARLTQPIEDAQRRIRPQGRSFGELVVAYAEQHLAQHPKEVGGENRGPWVRLYTGGKEGRAWPWCAAFVSFILKQACETLGVTLPIAPSLSCDSLAASAKQRKRLLAATSPAQRSRIGPGSIFLVRRKPGDWVHTGIVVLAASDYFVTIEGNTNDSGDREGYEVCKRTRGYGKKDFVLI